MQPDIALICLTVVVLAQLVALFMRKTRNADFEVAKSMFNGMQDAFQAGRRQAVADHQAAKLDNQWSGPVWPDQLKDDVPYDGEDEDRNTPDDMPDGTEAVVDITEATMKR